MNANDEQEAAAQTLSDQLRIIGRIPPRGTPPNPNQLRMPPKVPASGDSLPETSEDPPSPIVQDLPPAIDWDLLQGWIFRWDRHAAPNARDTVPGMPAEWSKGRSLILVGTISLSGDEEEALTRLLGNIEYLVKVLGLSGKAKSQVAEVVTQPRAAAVRVRAVLDKLLEYLHAGVAMRDNWLPLFVVSVEGADDMAWEQVLDVIKALYHEHILFFVRIKSGGVPGIRMVHFRAAPA